MKRELTPEVVRKVYEPALIDQSIQTEQGEIIIGQERAVKALKFGVGIRADGYNIYVSGTRGTGKLTAVKNFVEEPARNEPLPSDWCYAMNFKDPYQPKKVRLPAGKAIAFRKDIKNLIREVHQALFKAFEHEDFNKRKQKIVDRLNQGQEDLITPVNERAAKDAILIEETPVDVVTVPLKDGKAMNDDEFNSLPDVEQKAIRKKQDKYIDEINKVFIQTRRLERDANEELLKLEQEVANFAIRPLVEEVEEKYAAVPDVIQHLAELKEDILTNLAGILIPEKESSDLPQDAVTGNNFIKRYEVNVLVDNSTLKGAPVVIELNPTYPNLFGRVDKESHLGTWITDLALIRRGSLHSANGGYLIIQVEELFKNLFSWESLKRALKSKEVVIEDAGEQWGFLTVKSLKPEPIPLQVKVILIGDPMLYHLLYAYDNDFRELFKVKADFDSSMVRNEKNTHDYIRFASMLSQKEGLLSLHANGMGKLIEYGSRLAEDQTKLSTRFNEIADILREANYYAMQEKSSQILADHIRKTVEEKLHRSNLIQERLHELIATHQILIDNKGKKVGQVNGLTIITMGDIDFGIPNRITCTTSIGKDGIIAIEREAELSGPIHTKGVMILTGYLMNKFIQDKPISLTAQLVFEQSYGEIEGDSASSSELYTILSSLSDLPIKQGIAVTGSINQKGEVQAVGGINEKIEGYFEVCKRLGWEEEQGVIIPAANITNLMLKEEVQEALRLNIFKIWAIDTVDDGIEILTGRSVGTPEEPGSVANLVKTKLDSYADKMKAFASEDIMEDM